MKKIYLAGGCFWGLEEYFRHINGVLTTRVGYANGTTTDTTYKKIKDTNHAETVYIEYDENVVNLKFLLKMYYKVIDPISVNRQKEDIGAQYRTGIYYIDEFDIDVITNSIIELEQMINNKVAIEIQKLTNFCNAEEYHQNYLQKNPSGYCHISKESFEESKKANK